MVNHFGENSGTDFSDNILNNQITATSQFQDKFNSTLGLIKTAILNVDADFSKYHTQIFSLPSFPKWSIDDPFGPNSLYTLIHGFQYGEIRLNNYKYNRSTKMFKGRISVTLMDDFGVDANDVNKASSLPFSKGIRSMWYLQHIKGYKPFRTVYSRKFEIKF